jgi:hypothetical protein
MRLTQNADGSWSFEQGAGVTGDPRTRSQLGRDTQEWVDRQRRDIARADELLRGLKTITMHPNVTGLRGAATEMVAGVAGAISPQVGDAVSRAGTGVDAETMGRMRTNLRTNLAPVTRLVRDDSGGRWTLQDKQRAEEIESSLDMIRSPQQASGAYKEMISMYYRGVAREAGQRRTPLPAEMDVASEEGIERFGAQLEDAGFSPAEVAEQIIELRKLSGIR